MKFLEGSGSGFEKTTKPWMPSALHAFVSVSSAVAGWLPGI